MLKYIVYACHINSRGRKMRKKCTYGKRGCFLRSPLMWHRPLFLISPESQSVAERSPLLTDITAWFTRLRATLPGFKDCLHSAPFSLKQMSPLYFIPFFMSISMLFQHFVTRAARHKRFSASDVVYFCYSCSKKISPKDCVAWIQGYRTKSNEK